MNATYPQYRMITIKNGIESNGPLAVRDTQAALRTFKGLRSAKVCDAAKVFAPDGELVVTF